MKDYIRILEKSLSENAPALSQCKKEQVLDMLYCCYSQDSGKNKEQVHRSFERIDKILEKLPLAQQDEVVDITCSLCDEQQREGFCDGIVLGFRLFQELSLDEDLCHSEQAVGASRNP